MSIPLVLAITFIAFVLTTFIPSDPAEVALRVNEIVPTEEAIESMRESLGLNKPFIVRYINWLRDLLKLDLGVSYVNNNRTVVGEISRSIPATLKLAGLSFLLVICISIPIAVTSAIFKNSGFDRLVRMLIFLSTAVPNYWMGLILIWIFAVKFKVFPTSGAATWRHYVLPSLTLSMTYLATYVRLIRNSMLENMKMDYVIYARARGLSEFSVMLKHVFKNSIQTSINALGMSIIKLVAGTFVIENIFAIPGIGRLCISSIFNRDYPMIQAYILMMGLMFVCCNLIIDIVQTLIDPRLKMGGANV